MKGNLVEIESNGECLNLLFKCTKESNLLTKKNFNSPPLSGTIRPILQLPNVIELSYYANICLPHISLDCVVVSILSYSRNQSLSMTELVEECLEYSEILRYEFIFTKPCLSLSKLIKKSVEKLKNQAVICENEVSYCNLLQKRQIS